MEVELTFVDGDQRDSVHWLAERHLAKDMLSFLQRELAQRNMTFDNIKGIGVLRGPGSFTGLRIGLTVLNTLARAQNIAIVGAVGDEWKDECIRRLTAGETDTIVLPEYGALAHITKPRK